MHWHQRQLNPEAPHDLVWLIGQASSMTFPPVEGKLGRTLDEFIYHIRHGMDRLSLLLALLHTKNGVVRKVAGGPPVAWSEFNPWGIFLPRMICDDLSDIKNIYSQKAFDKSVRLVVKGLAVQAANITTVSGHHIEQILTA